jgi:hypothetical protein
MEVEQEALVEEEALVEMGQEEGVLEEGPGEGRCTCQALAAIPWLALSTHL